MDREVRIYQFSVKEKHHRNPQLPKFCLSGQTSNYLGNGFGPKLRAEDLVHLARSAPHFPNFAPSSNEHDHMAIAAQHKLTRIAAIPDLPTPKACSTTWSDNNPTFPNQRCHRDAKKPSARAEVNTGAGDILTLKNSLTKTPG